MKQVTIHIPDMQSAHCQARLRIAMQKLGGIQIQQKNAGTLSLQLVAGHLPEEVEHAISKAGYTVIKTEVNLRG